MRFWDRKTEDARNNMDGRIGKKRGERNGKKHLTDPEKAKNFANHCKGGGETEKELKVTKANGDEKKEKNS